MKRPAFQFYPADWRNNAKLRRCSHAARGAWIDTLCILHDSDEYGVLRWPLRDIAQAAGAPMTLLRELAAKSVIKGSDTAHDAYVYRPRHAGKDGEPVTLVEAGEGPCWYSSRLVRDEWVRHRRGASTQFDGEPNRAPKRRPKSQPKPTFGDGSGYGPTSSSSSSPSVTTTPIPPPPNPEALRPNHADPEVAAMVAQTPAARLAKEFLMLRAELWPETSRLPAPTMTIETHAAALLADDAPVDLVAEILGRQMRKMAQSGRSPPNSLNAYTDSLRDGIASWRQRPGAVPRPAGEDPDIARWRQMAGQA